MRISYLDFYKRLAQNMTKQERQCLMNILRGEDGNYTGKNSPATQAPYISKRVSCVRRAPSQQVSEKTQLPSLF